MTGRTWTNWAGDELTPPVDENTMVDVKDRDGFVWLNVRAGSHPWLHLDSDHDIVAYRLATNAEGGAA